MWRRGLPGCLARRFWSWLLRPGGRLAGWTEAGRARGWARLWGKGKDLPPLCPPPPPPQLRNLLLDPAPHKLLVLAGPCLEGTGELLLQTGGFSSHHFLQVLEDQEVSPAPTTCSTPHAWRGGASARPGTPGQFISL